MLTVLHTIYFTRAFLSARSTLSGETENVHEVMLKMQEAHIQFQLVTEVRNKMVEVYQEISRMQI